MGGLGGRKNQVKKKGLDREVQPLMCPDRTGASSLEVNRPLDINIPAVVFDLGSLSELAE